ncbi:MAG: hypothetical protein ABI609_11010 [Acidobacteriota bacterium]
MFGSLLFDLAPGVPAAKPLSGAPPPPAAPAGPTPQGIQALAFLVGGVWATTSGAATVSERVVWDATETFLMTEVIQSVSGQPAGLARGYFGYAPAAQTLLSSALSTSGTYTGGYETSSPDANTWVFAMMCGSGPNIQSVQVTMQHASADELTIAQAIQVDGAWVTKGSATYLRQCDPSLA